MNLKNLTYSLIVYTLIIIAILLFSKKKKHISVILLGLYSLAQIICIGNYFLYVYNEYVFNHFPQLFFFPKPFLFVIIPLFYLYIKTSIYPEYNVQKRWIYHFLPFVVMVLYSMVAFWFRSEAYIHGLIRSGALVLKIDYFLVTLLFNTQYLFYCIGLMIMLKQIKKEKQILLHTVFNIRLLNATIYMYQAGFILSVTTNAIDLLKLLPDYDVNFLNSLYFYFFFLFLFFITVRGYNTKELFKYTNQNTSHEERIRLYGRILNEVNRNQSYLEPTLTLKQFSDLLHEDSRLVSQSINQLFGSNFNDFINHHRIELSKQMLATMPGLTIQEIMFQTGFNSKATFNKVFKKHTGMTPTNYKTGHFKG